jgi:hypothetical protein
MPAYTCSHYAGIFFIVFQLVGLYFMLNVLLAVAYVQVCG